MSKAIIIGVPILLSLVILGFLINRQHQKPDLGAKLNPPTNLQAIPQTDRIRLDWTATNSTAEADYTIYQAGARTGPFQKIATTKRNSYEVKGLKKDTPYYFQVTASLNNVAESNPATVGPIGLAK